MLALKKTTLIIIFSPTYLATFPPVYPRCLRITGVKIISSFASSVTKGEIRRKLSARLMK